MLIRLETGSGVPVTRQIMDQIRRHCATGLVVAGDRLPSVRELARQLAVNQNTILKVYERLTAEGLLERRHGDGTFVADFRPEPRLKRERLALELAAGRLVDQGRSLGLADHDIRALLERALRQQRIAVETQGDGHE